MNTNQKQFGVKMERKDDHLPPKRIESAIHKQILNDDLTIVSCVYEPLLQADEFAFISELINVNY